MLRRDPLDAEDALRRVFIANRDSVLIGRGVIQSLQFVQALELNHDNAGRGCRAFVGDGLTAPHDEFAARVRKRLGYEREIFLIVPVLALDGNLSDVVGRWLGLSMKGLNRSRAERSTRDHCQSDGDMPTHVPPAFLENGRYCSRPAPAATVYGYNQLGLGGPLLIGAVPQPNVAGGHPHGLPKPRMT